MFRNYLKIALRHIRKHKVYAFINIIGLAVGMGCCLLISLFVRDELAFDRYHEKADRIFRLVDAFDEGTERDSYYALSSAPFAPTLKREISQVEDAVRFLPGRRPLVAYGERKAYEDRFYYADSSVFGIFTFPLIKGDPAKALVEPNTLVVSERIAAKYFGREDPYQKTLKVNDRDFLVTGVMADWPRRSHFTADILGSMATHEQNPANRAPYFDNWVRHEFYTYLLLKDAGSADAVGAQLPGFIDKHAAASVKVVLGSKLASRLQPLTSIHLRSHLQLELTANGDIKYVTVFSIIAVFILLIACVNFMNLATARSAARLKEVGLRKVVGASRAQLVRQFLGESFLFTALALALAVLIVVIALPAFNGLAGKGFAPRDLANAATAGSLLAILLVVGFLSGSYPALFISAFQPASVLKKPGRTASGKSVLRKALVIGQFSISIGLIIATAVVLDQLDYLRNGKLGFDKDHVVVIPVRAGSVRTNIEAIKGDLKTNPAILAATLANGVPGGQLAGDSLDLLTDEGKKRVTVAMIYCDQDYVRTMGMEILEGRDFSRQMGTDAKEAFIVNEAAVRVLGLANPLDTRLEWNDMAGKVVGVVRDFQYQSLRQEIQPLVFHIAPNYSSVLAVRVRPDHIPDTLAYLERKWKDYDPAHPFEYRFMDETFDAVYRGEERLGRIFSLAAGLAIVIASLGLFGLALYTVEARTKEIGIRKVLGASLGKIAVLLTWEFALLVLLANAVAWPAAYLLMRRWLQNFAYRVDLGPAVFLFSAGAAFLIALLTIGYQTLKAARADPVKSIRYE
jgi:putative ABC transport system permease protein